MQWLDAIGEVGELKDALETAKGIKADERLSEQDIYKLMRTLDNRLTQFPWYDPETLQYKGKPGSDEKRPF